MSAASLFRSSYASLLACVCFLSMLSLGACHSSQGENTAAAGIRSEEAQKYIGTYSGTFNKSIITLVINYISGKTVSGYNVHKGLRRNINGEVTRNGSLLNFVLKEPGDNPFDGIFTFTLDTADLAIRGTWTPLDSTKTKSKTLTLSRRQDAGQVDNDTWVAGGAAAGDSVLTFNNDGTCEFGLYERPQDSTSQLITIRGNYEQKADTFRIEWEKNTHMPAQSMRLVIYHPKENPADSGMYQPLKLRGHGLEFFTMIGD
jgi:hypothetical protein